MKNYLDCLNELIKKVDSEKLIIYRIRDCGLYGESHLFLIPQKETKDIKSYLQKNNPKLDDSLIELIEDDYSTTQIFNGPLERENLSLENITKLISNGFVQIRTNKTSSKKK